MACGESESCSVVSNSLQLHGLYSPQNSPGQNNGVGSISLLQGIVPTQGSNSGLLHCRQFLYHLSHQGSWKWKSLSHVWFFATPWTIQSMWFSRPLPFPGDLPNPGIKPRSPALQAASLPAEPQEKPKNTGVGSLSLLQKIFPTQESNQGLLNCRWILYQLSYEGNPYNQLVQLMANSKSAAIIKVL